MWNTSVVADVLGCKSYYYVHLFKMYLWTQAHTIGVSDIILYVKSDLFPFIIIIGAWSISPNYINHHPQIWNGILHPAGSVYGPVFIRDKLKFKAHEAQTQITPPASLLKMSFILQGLCLSHLMSSVWVCTKGTNQKTSQCAEIYQPTV